MFRVKSTDKLGSMGFGTNDSGDFELKKIIGGNMKLLFKIYKGSDYLRHSKTGYVVEEQLKLIYEWTKSDLIFWEDE